MVSRSKAHTHVIMKKAVRAYYTAIDKRPTGFLMSLDATASGLQILATLIGCHKTASQVNLINTGTRMDCYLAVADIMNIQYGCDVDRGIVKKPVMTSFYGSLGQPKSVFGDGTPEYVAFQRTLLDLFPGAMEVMTTIQACWDINALYHQWTLPDGHTSKVKVMHTVEKKIEIAELNKATFTHRSKVNLSSRDAHVMVMAGKYIEMDNQLSLAANITHSIDGYIVREMTRRAYEQHFPLIHIHDSFWSSPNFMNQVRRNYVNILADIAEMDLLENILNEITGRNGKFTKYTDNLGSLIREANYPLS